MKAELIDIMGDDLRVANAARVSFDKESEWQIGYETGIDHYGAYEVERKDLHDRDIKLINYLAKHDHWTPFSHVMITMRETVPIFVARQRFKHKVGFTENEISRRYVDDDLKFWTPEEWRAKAENVKQGSSNEIVSEVLIELGNFNPDIEIGYNDIIALAERWYYANVHICAEQRRAILPQALYTSYYVTGSLAAWARAYKLRSHPHAQKEIQDLAAQWNEVISNIPELKHSWNALISQKIEI